MVTQIDRLQLAVTDRKAAAEGWVKFLGATPVREDTVRCLNAKRSVYQVGRSEVEFLEPDGAGAIADSLSAHGRNHLFGAGVATPDLGALVSRVKDLGVDCVEEGAHAYVKYAEDGQNDLCFVLSEVVEREPVGLINKLYEVTVLVDDFRPMMDAVTRLFNLDADHYSRITSEQFKYDGFLTLFNPDTLDRFEVIHPTSPETTMGRYHARQGRVFYMAYAETPHILKIEQHAKEAGVGVTARRPEGRAETEMADSIWLHPPVLGGMMLGLSRPMQAWTWSGRPERALPI